jgi:hypothetical protein
LLTRVLLIIHRYLGVAVGLLMAMWCLSGAVMMYVSYPALSERELLRGLSPLQLADCCTIDATALPDEARIARFRVLMMAGAPVLHVEPEVPPALSFYLDSGRPFDAFNWAQTGQVAREFAARSGIGGEPKAAYEIERDQWTVTGEYRNHRPLYRFRFDDRQKSDVYVSSSTGEVKLVTTRTDRFWSWLGAVPHWLYPTVLREKPALWTQIVIWTSLIGVFLTLTGLYVGITHIRRGPGKRWTPYHGFSLWHHIAGLCAGVLVFTWVLSGLLSMNPWGLLEGGEGGGDAAQSQRGESFTAADLRQFLQAVRNAQLSDDIVLLASAADDGRLYVVAKDSTGRAMRVDANAAPAPLAVSALSRIAQRVAGGRRIFSQEMLAQEDDFYYAHHGYHAEHASLALPVYRVVLADEDATHIYLDAATGELVRYVDGATRWYRWLHSGLHSFDFSAWLRKRPLWDIVVLVLLAGTTISCFTGAWLSIRRIGRDLRLTRNR